MNTLEIFGIIFIICIGAILLYHIIRITWPKKYTPKNCPIDHDNYARYGVIRCPKCGQSLNMEEDYED